MTAKKILIVEDCVHLAALISEILKQSKFEVIITNDGKAAQKSVVENEFDAIVLDLMMPLIDGKKFLKWIRKELQNNTPILIHTGTKNFEIEQELLSLGANAVTFKPIRAKKLVSAVQAIL